MASPQNEAILKEFTQKKPLKQTQRNDDLAQNGLKKQQKRVQINSPKRRRCVIAKFLIKPLKAGAKTRKNERKKKRLQAENPNLAPLRPKTPPQSPSLGAKGAVCIDSGRGVSEFWFFPENLGFQRHWGRGRVWAKSARNWAKVSAKLQLPPVQTSTDQFGVGGGVWG